MEIKIFHGRKSIANPNILYLDVEISWGMIIKGMVYNIKKNQVFFPTHKTEAGHSFSPIILLPDIKKKFVEQFLEQIQDFPMPKEEEVVTNEKRKEIMAKYADRRPEKKVPRGSSGQKEDSSPATSGGSQKVPPTVPSKGCCG